MTVRKQINNSGHLNKYMYYKTKFGKKSFRGDFNILAIPKSMVIFYWY